MPPPDDPKCGAIEGASFTGIDFYNLGETPPLYFWRDQSGSEIDLLIHVGQREFPIEIKLSQTYHPKFKKAINQWLSLKGNRATNGLVVYCGEHPMHTSTSIPALRKFSSFFVKNQRGDAENRIFFSLLRHRDFETPR
ncbi:MAG: hypothetical protein JJU12_02955 [Chlamydiales bacterium]|nr:hypothetical protein [Chlamydiales bacterium]